MNGPIARRQIFEYDIDNPFHVYCIPYPKPENISLLFNRWHEELEIVYTLRGHSIHYINGMRTRSKSGRLIVVNFESAHGIIPDREMYGDGEKVVIVLIISREFLETVFPDLKFMYFLSEKETAHPEIGTLMLELSRFHDSVKLFTYEKIYIKGLVLQLLCYITQEGMAEKDVILPISSQKNIEQLKGIMQYIENHYKGKLTQCEIAEKFYFSEEYFARLFKKRTGVTFVEYLTKYGLQEAQAQPLSSDVSILDVALNSGFSDDHRLILALKKQYGITPSQYRRVERNREKQQDFLRDWSIYGHF